LKWTKNEEPNIEEGEHDQDHDNGWLGALDDDKHNQNHNNEVGPIFYDNHQEEYYNGKKSQTHIWVLRQQRSWWRPLAHHHHHMHNTR
jgi:hypothetical protein